MHALSRIFFVLLFTSLVFGSQCFAQGTPAVVVQTTVNAVLASLHDEALDEAQKRQRIEDIVSDHFDFKAMTSRVLATNWKRASGTQKQRITTLFRRQLLNTYWQKISGFSGQKIEYLGQQTRGEGYVSCPTIVHTKSTRIPIDYKLYRVGDRWMAYDVVIEQVSLVRNYRSKFQSIVRAEGIPGLIAHLRDENS